MAGTDAIDRSARSTTYARTIHDVEGPADDGGDDAVPHEAHGNVGQGAGEGDPEVLLGPFVVRDLREAAERPERDGVAGARVAEGGEAVVVVVVVRVGGWSARGDGGGGWGGRSHVNGGMHKPIQA